MTAGLPEEITALLEQARALHQRTASDYQQCLRFNRLMVELLDRLEDQGRYRLADRVMGILLDCNPKEGSSCEKSSQVSERIRKLGQ